jgi:hypothetical protein
MQKKSESLIQEKMTRLGREVKRRIPKEDKSKKFISEYSHIDDSKKVLDIRKEEYKEILDIVHSLQ